VQQKMKKMPKLDQNFFLFFLFTKALEKGKKLHPWEYVTLGKKTCGYDLFLGFLQLYFTV